MKLFNIHFLFVILSFASCSEVKKESIKDEIIHTDTINAVFTQQNLRKEDCRNKSDLEIYYLMEYVKNNKESLGFISLSDNYRLSKNQDSLAIPDLQSTNIEEADYFILDSTYRARFLFKTNITENDSVYIYNYSNDSLLSFQVSKLKIVATLSNYTGTDEWPYSQYEYMFGFEINMETLKDYDKNWSNAIVYVGRENPFFRGGIKSILWKKINPEAYPVGTINLKQKSELLNFKVGSYYKFETEDFNYYICDLIVNDLLQARYLIVLQSGTKQIVKEMIYYESEGESLNNLNLGNLAYGQRENQWTGKLFKNLPPVIYGFQYHSFGCPSITLLNKSACDIYINCDNRH